MLFSCIRTLSGHTVAAQLSGAHETIDFHAMSKILSSRFDPHNTALPLSLGRQTSQGRSVEIDGLGEFELDSICSPLDNLKQTHYFKGSAGAEVGGNMKSFMKELKNLHKQLEKTPRLSTFVRFDSEEPAFLRVLISGVDSTPYASGLFLFDIYCQPSYPDAPPSVVHITPGVL